jgi:GTP-binding protein HflX
MRGEGETQLQIDRRLTREQMVRVKKDLRMVEKQHRVKRRTREEMTNISLVGYTNAGKSTLFNTLTGANQLAEDKLFATLDTTTRVVALSGNQQVLLSDTVGFIKKLPHHLVAAFKATLEEVAEANLLLHVVDASHPQAAEQIDAVNTVLETLNASELPTLMVFNKIDLLKEQVELQILRAKYPDSVAISAETGEGLELLKAELAERFAVHTTDISLTIPYAEGKILDFLYKHGEVLETDYQGDGIQVKARIPDRYLKSVHPFICRRGC